jgi:hypothetical protein
MFAVMKVVSIPVYSVAVHCAAAPAAAPLTTLNGSTWTHRHKGCGSVTKDVEHKLTTRC